MENNSGNFRLNETTDFFYQKLSEEYRGSGMICFDP
jgi:hypothetical protein